ncbi:MAG: hypothetical protein NXI31_18870 [bacterium]|nr:hypothetical protein [bacterium]
MDSQPDLPRRERLPLWTTGLAMVGLALVVFLPAALDAQFLAFDDNFFFGPDNPEFRSGFAAVLDPSRPIANAFLPVAHASLWFDWALFDGPFMPHLHSLLLQALAAVVFVRWLGRLGVAPLAAHAAGALFVVHPTMAESVTWASGRKDLLAALFVFLALHQCARFAQAGGVLRLGVIGLCGVFAMYAKATAVVLPFLALLATFAPAITNGRRFVGPALLFVVVLPIALHHQSIAAEQGTLAAGSFTERLAQVPGVFLHYLTTAVWPADLNVLYPELQTLERFRAALVPGSLGLLAFLAVAVALLFAGRRSARWPLAGVLLLAFAVALLPFNTAWPASSIAAADRYLHLAIPGLAAAFAVLLHALLGRAGGIAALVLALPLGWLGMQRAHDFVNTETLWRQSLAADGDNAVAHFNLAAELMRRVPLPLAEVENELDAAVAAARYPIHGLRASRLQLVLQLQQGKYERAAEQSRNAIAAARQLHEREPEGVRRERAEALFVETLLESFEPLRLAGDEAGAQASYREALAAVPDHPEVVAFGSLLELATVADELRDPAGPRVLPADESRVVAAVQALDAAMAEHRDHHALAFARASWERVRGDTVQALRFYRKAQAAAPTRVDAWREAARMLRQQAFYESAERYAKDGLRHREDPALRQEWALSLIGLGRLDDAILQLQAYLKARPDDGDAKKILANVLVGRAYARLSDGGSHAEALRIVEQALTLNPDEHKAHLVLGRVARERRKFAEAVVHLEKSHRLLPDFEDAVTMLADSLRDLGMERMLQKDDFGAGDAWLRFLEVAPKSMDREGVQLQLKALWRRHENRGITALQEQPRDVATAEREFRRCLKLDPDQHWVAWLLAQAIHERPDVDLAELELLLRQAVAWQERHELDASGQVYLLAMTLARRGESDAAEKTAREWLDRGQVDGAQPGVLAALRRLAGR